MENSSFRGFRVPEQNWFKLPNEWTDITHDITSLAELKVVEYVLRHTWGFSEYGQMKKITLDEFQNGRKRKDGNRMDRGTGLSQPSIIEGLKRAVGDGFLTVREDGEDRGRMKKYYGLRILGSDLKNVESAYKESLDASKDSLDRTEKDTPIRKIPKKNIRGTSESAPSKSGGFHSSEFDNKAAALLREVLVMHDSDLVAPPGGVRLATLSKSIKSLRLSGRPTATERNIIEVIKWLRKNYGDEHTPKMHKANDFYTCWERFRTAWQRDVGEDATVEIKVSPDDRKASRARYKLKRRVQEWVAENVSESAQWALRDWHVKRALIALGEEPDALTVKDWEE